MLPSTPSPPKVDIASQSASTLQLLANNDIAAGDETNDTCSEDKARADEPAEPSPATKSETNQYLISLPKFASDDEGNGNSSSGSDTRSERVDEAVVKPRDVDELRINTTAILPSTKRSKPPSKKNLKRHGDESPSTMPSNSKKLSQSLSRVASNRKRQTSSISAKTDTKHILCRCRTPLDTVANHRRTRTKVYDSDDTGTDTDSTDNSYRSYSNGSRISNSYDSGSDSSSDMYYRRPHRRQHDSSTMVSCFTTMWTSYLAMLDRFIESIECAFTKFRQRRVDKANAVRDRKKRNRNRAKFAKRKIANAKLTISKTASGPNDVVAMRPNNES